MNEVVRLLVVDQDVQVDVFGIKVEGNGDVHLDLLHIVFVAVVDKVRVDPNMCLSNLASQGSCDWGEEQIQQQFTSSLGDRGRPHRGGQDYARERGLCVWKIGE